jgi:hypothetical protein
LREKHPRFKLHFIPTSSSWLNPVERLFAEITRQRIRRGVFTSDRDLDRRAQHQAPFKWTAKADSILEKYTRTRQVLVQLAAGTN